MNRPQNQRRGVVIGLSALAGLVTAALGVVGTAQHVGLTTQQQDITLAAVGDGAIDPINYNAADDAHAALISAQVAQDHALFDQQIAWQESIYYWAQQHDLTFLFAVGDGSPPSTNLLNGAFTRFSEALVVLQANQQVHWDHLLGVNQTLGAGGYEQQIADILQADLGGTGIDPTSHLGMALAALDDAGTLTSFHGFVSALDALTFQLYQTGFFDVLGAFIPSLTP